jgi:peptidoglycan/LPS O-acetylase OafA/YrhL
VKPFTVLFLVFVGVEPFYHFIGGYASCLTMMWLIGMGAAIFFHRLPALRVRMPFLTERRIYRLGLAAVPVGLVLMAGRLFANKYVIYELQLGLFLGLTIFGLLFALGQVKVVRGGLLARFCGALAAYSYSLYLTHHSILEFFHVRHPEWVGSLTAFWALILLSNLVAIAFWWAFERHHRQLARWARAHLPRGPVRGVPLATSS